MADQQNRGGQKQGSNQPETPDQHKGVRGNAQSDTDTLQNQGGGTNDAGRQGGGEQPKGDDPSRAPESGDRK